MCSPDPPKFKPEPIPDPLPTPPPPEQTQKAPVTKSSSKYKQATKAKKTGASSLIIDLFLPSKSGLNI